MLARLLQALSGPAAAAMIATARPTAAATAPIRPSIVAAAPAGRRKVSKRFIVGSAVATLGIATITQFEGVRTTAYRDSVGIPTVCIGETKGVRMGQRFTLAECQAMLVERLGSDFAPAIERCITRPMGDDFYVAALSLSYNIGTGGLCKSSVVRHYNAGDRRAACNAFLLYDKGGKPLRVLAGLVKRRQAERAMCLKGV
ncbi:lysozyme [uncultured Methylobacterium sp.]|uniref:lysozyme n=1 Tax=uncultured Methylobacterium sp. TaxID=157278 RepID=UPI0035CBE973